MAHQLARRLLPEHSCKFSRHDFTLAQLFACLVVREFFGLSFRRAEALLNDSPAWLADVGLAKAPDHNTLWRASDALLTSRRCGGTLRSRTPGRQKKEMMLRVLVHNISLLCDEVEG
ncbi:MAG TPA: transposase [Tepidisphaeraceae bacterium]|nr:transposase [Tepidisphaeraceae bacterium]